MYVQSFVASLCAVRFPRQTKNEAGAKLSRYRDHTAGFATRELAILYLKREQEIVFLFAASKRLCCTSYPVHAVSPGLTFWSRNFTFKF